MSSYSSPSRSPAPDRESPGTTFVNPTNSRVNALSGRISSVLSFSYVDSGVEEALQTLETEAIDPDADLASVRQRFRLNVQRRVIEENAAVIQDFSPVAEQLRHVGQLVKEIKKRVSEAQTNLDNSRSKIQTPLEEARELLKQLDVVKNKQALLDATTSHFTAPVIAPVPQKAVASELEDAFFDRLEKLVRIHQDSQVLLGADNQQLGLDILSVTSTQLNNAYETLYNAVVKQWRTLDIDDRRSSAKVRRALLALAARPSLFRSSLDSFAEIRSKILTDSFFGALMGSSAADPGSSLLGGAQDGAIDIYEHDPLRHSSEMLAWIHGAVVSETEALTSVFFHDKDGIKRDMEQGKKNEPWNLGDEGDVFDPKTTIQDLVDRSLGGAATLLQQRMKKTIHDFNDPATILKLSNLSSFYTEKFTKLLGSVPSSSIVGVSMIGSFLDLNDMIQSQFRHHLKDIVQDLPHIHEEGDRDHVQIDQSEYIELLTGIIEPVSQLLSVAELSFMGELGGSVAFGLIKSEVLESVVRANRERYLESQGSSSGQTELMISELNAQILIRDGLAPHPSAGEYVKQFILEISKLASRLEQDQHLFLRQQSGLVELFELAESATNPGHGQSSGAEAGPGAAQEAGETNTSRMTLHIPFEQILSHPQLQEDTLSSLSADFDAFLSSALLDARDRIRHLSDASLVRDVTDGAARRFCAQYSRLEWMLEWLDDNAMDAKKNQVPLRSLFPRSTEDVRVLLN